MPLEEYRRKRDFKKTPEPEAEVSASKSGRAYIIQKHDASRLHYDFRLEHDGVLKSWAVPKGPSLNPAERRLAVEVEDHPVAYGEFEGHIPEQEYGGGTVLLWDRGTWQPEGDAEEGLRSGRLTFTLLGEKLQGEWSLVRIKGKEDEEQVNWLLMKKKDNQADTGTDILKTRPESVLSGRTMDEIKAAPERVWKGGRSQAIKRAGKQSPSTAKDSNSEKKT